MMNIGGEEKKINKIRKIININYHKKEPKN